MTKIVFLPATEPGDTTYGAIPEDIEAYPDILIHRITFPTLEWYNKSVRNDAISQLQSIATSPVILVGFSKSGLGAWNIARAVPDLIEATIIFDAPVAREELPPWGTSPFYDGDGSWQEDQPIRTVDAFQSAVSKTHSLVLISGEGFHEEMCALSQAASEIGLEHVFLPRSKLAHNWQSGWIEEGLKAIFDTDSAPPEGIPT